MIRKATLDDIDVILGITKACATYMIDQGIYQWNDQYPNRKTFENDVKRSELYLVEHNKKVVGCIVLTPVKDDEYVPIQWCAKDHNIYIHRLAVHPTFQGQGVAQQLMTFAEKFAQEKGYLSVRLDTFSRNNRNQKFYETRGYKRLGTIYFPLQSDHPFFCYELVF